MIRLLIVDDEPLVQIGLQSMICWNDLGIELCPSASNGQLAWEIIQEYKPEIVITDIKMPVMNGLDLVKKCREQNSKLPIFLMLTSYEDFQYVRAALQYQVSDYLIKLELTPDMLTEAIRKCLQQLKEQTESYSGYSEHPQSAPSSANDMNELQDKFYLRLLYNLFDATEQFRLQASEYHLSFTYSGYQASYCTILVPPELTLDHQTYLTRYSTAIQMLKELLAKYLTCYLVSLDLLHFCIIFFLSDNTGSKTKIETALCNTFHMVHNYCNVQILCGIGSMTIAPEQLSDSFQEARQIAGKADSDSPILFYDDILLNGKKNVFNFSLFRQDLMKAFEEYDAQSLEQIYHQLDDLFQAHPACCLQAIDAASNILYLSMSLLPDGEALIQKIFLKEPAGYHSIYKKNTMEQIQEWMHTLMTGLCNALEEHKRDYKNRLVMRVQQYIQAHVEERISLNEIACLFGISPNYLSQIFKRYSDSGFSEYIQQSKINRAKELLAEGKLKVYEIAEMLGFENAFYFSRVFKKVTGVTPKEYMQLPMA